MRHQWISFWTCRSEIHENMNCNRCKMTDVVQGNSILDESMIAENKDTTDKGQLNQQVDDIGGFAQIAGCLHKLKSSEKQVCLLSFVFCACHESISWSYFVLCACQLGSPLEEDLASWGHHFNLSTVPDLILQASAGDEVLSYFSDTYSCRMVLFIYDIVIIYTYRAYF